MPIPDREHRRGHPAPFQVAQQIRPALLGLAVSVADRDQLLGAIEAHAHHHQDAEAVLLEADGEVHSVHPDVDEVLVRKRLVHERALFVLPLGSQPGDHRRRQPGGRTEELLERGHEVAARHAMQVEERQHLGDLRGLPAPRRHNRALEPHAFTRLGIDPPVVDARRPDLDPARHRRDRARVRVPIPDHHPVAVLVHLAGQRLDIAVGFGFQRRRQHALRALPADLVQARAQLRARGLVSYYLQHRRSFLAGIRVPAVLVGQAGRYAAPSNKPAIHNFWL